MLCSWNISVLKFRDKKKESTKDYRVTMIFRRESGAWHIVHRQADSQIIIQAPGNN